MMLALITDKQDALHTLLPCTLENMIGRTAREQTGFVDSPKLVARPRG
jgi:hypothetical protein